MKNKIIAVFLAAMCLITVLIPNKAFAEESGMLGILNELEIMQGDGDGNFRLDDTVTRAEFTKVAVAASAFRNSVPAGLSVSPFPDVNYKNWAAPYIKVALANSIVSGYPDGTFRPSQTVTYEEGLTILLRLLGYGTEDFGSSWPSGQIGLAENIELTKNVSRVKGEALTRRDVANLAYNLLGLKAKGGNAEYITTFEWTLADDAEIVSVNDDDNTILTTDKTYKLADNFSGLAIGCEGTLFINKSGKAAYFVSDSESGQGEKYVVYSVLGDAVVAYDSGNLSQVSLSGDTVTYLDSQKTTYSAAKAKLSIGDVMYVKRDKAGKIDYISVTTNDMEGPVRVDKGASWYSSLGVSSLSGIKIMRDSSGSDAASLETNDIAYYSGELNMIFAYSKKVTGIYESASPNRDTPTSVTVSGTTYNIESAAAYNALSSSGSCRLGDTVTLLLGKNGEIAGVASPETAASAVYGYLVDSSVTEQDLNDDGTTETVYTASIVSADGERAAYTVKKDCSAMKNKIVKIAFDSGVGTVTSVNNNSSVSGKVDAKSLKLGSYNISADAKILDVASDDPDGYTLYKRIYVQRLDGKKIDSGDVLYYEKNSADEITTLFLKDVTGDMYEYGIVTSSPKINNGTGVFGYRIGSKTGTWNQTSKLCLLAPETLSTGIGARFASVTSGGGAAAVMNADALFAVKSVKDITREYLISSDSVKYEIDESATAYKKNASGDYMQVDISEVLDPGLNIRAYYDASPSEGGRIRVIISE